ncbi:MAG: YfiR family protein [Phycisphaerae bacterium]|nr:YfiR family protein [Phycisphaerae bacterium]
MKIKTYIFAVVFLVLLLAAQSLAESLSSREYQIKAAFLYNFLMFVDWPPEKMGGSADPIIIGIIGDDNFENAFEPIKDKQVNNRSVIVKRFKGLEELKKSSEAERNKAMEDIKKCHLLYICRSEQAVMKEIAALIKDSNVLIVGSMEKFLESGGMINFVLEEDKVRFEINLIAAKQAKLQIRSQLLRLAKKVIGEEREAKN